MSAILDNKTFSQVVTRLHNYYTFVGVDKQKTECLVSEDFKLIPKTTWKIRLIQAILRKLRLLNPQNTNISNVIYSIESYARVHTELDAVTKEKAKFVTRVLENIRSKRDRHFSTLSLINRFRHELDHANMNDKKADLQLLEDLEKRYLKGENICKEALTVTIPERITELAKLPKRSWTDVVIRSSGLGQRLESEVLRMVFLYLEAKDLARVMSSCKAWKSAASDCTFWRKLAQDKEHRMLFSSLLKSDNLLDAFRQNRSFISCLSKVKGTSKEVLSYDVSINPFESSRVQSNGSLLVFTLSTHMHVFVQNAFKTFVKHPDETPFLSGDQLYTGRQCGGDFRISHLDIRLGEVTPTIFNGLNVASCHPHQNKLFLMFNDLSIRSVDLATYKLTPVLGKLPCNTGSMASGYYVYRDATRQIALQSLENLQSPPKVLDQSSELDGLFVTSSTLFARSPAGNVVAFDIESGKKSAIFQMPVKRETIESARVHSGMLIVRLSNQFHFFDLLTTKQIKVLDVGNKELSKMSYAVFNNKFYYIETDKINHTDIALHAVDLN